MQQQLRNMMTSDVYKIRENESCEQAAKIMSEHNIGAIPVVNEGGQMVGIVTDRDITLRATAQGQAAQTSVREVMSSGNLIQATPEMDVHEAAKLMAQHQIRRLPVVENGQIVGMVALGDIATNNQLDDDAEAALTNISKPAEPQH